MSDVSASLPAAPSSRTVTPALILRATDVAAVMDPASYAAAVEAAFVSHATGNAIVPMAMHIALDHGGFHAKAACLALDRRYVAVKVNGNFPHNRARNGLPTIQGAVLLFDCDDGSLLAVVDSAEITLRRTAATSVLAAKHLAREGADSIAICGGGVQGRAHAVAFAAAFALKRVAVWDIDPSRARALATDVAAAAAVDVDVAADVRDAARRSDIVVTATSARMPFLTRECVSPGTFIAAVGADSPDKNEIHADLVATSTIVVDSLAQCVVMGDLHHALVAGAIAEADVHAELADVVAGRMSGRTSADEVIVFDSTGLAIEDVASAAMAYRRALAAGIGTPVVLFAV